MGRRLVAILLSTLPLFALPAHALSADGASANISLCCTEEVFAVNLVFAVSGMGEITGVSRPVDVRMLGRNATDGKLYVAPAAAVPIECGKTLAQVFYTGTIDLTPESLLLSRKTVALSCRSHGAAGLMQDIAPTCDHPRSMGGATCAVYSAVLEQNTVLPALRSTVTAVLSALGELKISTVLSGDETIGNTVLLAVCGSAGVWSILC